MGEHTISSILRQGKGGSRRLRSVSLDSDGGRSVLLLVLFSVASVARFCVHAFLDGSLALIVYARKIRVIMVIFVISSLIQQLSCLNSPCNSGIDNLIVIDSKHRSN